MTRSLARFLFLPLVMAAVSFHAPYAGAQEEEASATDAPARASAKAAAPVAAAAEKEEAKPLTDAQKTAAIAAADAIAAYDADKVVGMAKDAQLYYQEPVSPTMKKLEGLYNYVQIIIFLIVIFVMILLAYVMVRFSKKNNPKPQTFTHNKTVEIIWTVVPILILVTIAIPSLRVHYKEYNNPERFDKADLTLKVVGHQWYWSYEYPDQGIAFDSNIKADKDLAPGEPRLLAVDNAIVVPVNKVVRVQLTAADVIHSWAVPAFGVKKDAVPGRLNETWFMAEKEGIYYGQCSELCGKSHGFMPIAVVVVSEEQFAAWVAGAKLKFADSGAIQLAALAQ